MSKGPPNSPRRIWIVPVGLVIALGVTIGSVVWNTDKGEQTSLVAVVPEISVPDPQEV